MYVTDAWWNVNIYSYLKRESGNEKIFLLHNEMEWDLSPTTDIQNIELSVVGLKSTQDSPIKNRQSTLNFT